MDNPTPDPPPLHLLQSRVRPPATPTGRPSPRRAWWQRWVSWVALRLD